MNDTTRLAGVSLGLMILAACGGQASATGELGRLDYTLAADFIPSDATLTENRVVTGYEQVFSVGTLERATRDFDGLYDVQHRFDPPGGVTLLTDPGEPTSDDEDEEVPNFRVTVTDPGVYTLFSELDGDVVDRLTLEFATPTEVELIARRRFPSEERFSDVVPGQAVPFGTQVSVLPIPSDAGERLMGDIRVTMSGTPEDAILQDVSVLSHVEQAVYTRATNTVYLVEVGKVALDVTEPVSGAAETLDFVVE